MATETAFIAFGSNRGNRQDFCDRAIALMGLLPHSQVTGTSSYYETEPVDMPQHPNDTWFYNGVVRIETQLSPERLLEICQETERSLGRDSHDQNEPRTIDLDLLFFGQRIINTPPLTIPHPRLHQRRFVLIPLAELDPDFVHPQQQQTIQVLLDQLKDSHQVRKLDLTPGAHYRIGPSCSPPPTN
ncbi:2-amino-4-hydroxy-6-hydroxymethyldihydropteridine diphosphokinase [Candidatus Nitronereus thalassa]|uniref:2-amino-4-hydroxy-6-hydroxymethyldihydropteridine pyrophosphokinase n=1 Tax=Candidatus Nitronereus thalassa TaxID=3020898 RepID=A0ABU3KAB0_9BACT|nr:2-amino-4-hydroxy-6-hydroxymethyldihydropteridine diphosphokinase [Candidatus Nitronereus thalassa]MDT7043228.1 2-amino-4-hydroxy-6-hydroxymethyldihydropteridine diphosphokinase [Candidatus Nitronereus thalassa]